MTGAHLAPVLDTLQYLHHETDCWLEITTLLIPGHNDCDAEIDAHVATGSPMSSGPTCRCTSPPSIPTTRCSTCRRRRRRPCRRARAIAIGNGLHYVYTGNVHDVEGDTTFCPGCHEALVRRDWYAVLSCRIETHGDARGTCPHCGTPIAGRFGAFARGFGRRRIPVRMAVH